MAISYLSEELLFWLGGFFTVFLFTAFFVGVYLATKLRLYEDVKILHLWLMSIPTGLLLTGLMISSSIAKVPGSGDYIAGYQDHIGKYVTFYALLIFYGTAVPDLFSRVRQKVLQGQNMGIGPPNGATVTDNDEDTHNNGDGRA